MLRVIGSRSGWKALGDAKKVGLPIFPRQSSVPRTIYQTFVSRDLPPALEENVSSLLAQNPGWRYQFFANPDFNDYILRTYGRTVLEIYESIEPSYGAARADFFRYLLMYKEGGVYLDIKSNCKYPLDHVIRPDDQFLLCGWNTTQEETKGFGLWKELRGVEGGELQQWHIICAPGHPFMRAVLEKVIENIVGYTGWRFGTGQLGVLRVTGPIAYTLAINPVRNQHEHRRIADNNQIGLIYNALAVDHKSFYKTHYLTNRKPVVVSRGARLVVNTVYRIFKSVKDKVYFMVGRN